MLCKMLFSGKNKKNVINLSSAELAQIVVMVKELLLKLKKDCIEICEWQFSLSPDCAVRKCIELYTRVVFTEQQIILGTFGYLTPSKFNQLGKLYFYFSV